MGHTVDNYGMYAADDKAQLTYVPCGILGALLLNSGAADYVVTGCGTGEGAMLLPRRDLRAKTYRTLLDGLKDIDQELFFAGCKDQAITDYVKGLL